jgi:hypothetical protein
MLWREIYGHFSDVELTVLNAVTDMLNCSDMQLLGGG